MLLVNQLAGFGVGSQTALAPISVSDVSEGTNTTNLTTHTFSSLSFGAAASDRYIAVAVSARPNNADPVSTVTAGGTSLDQQAEIRDSTNNATVAIFWASVPTGTSGDVVVVLNAAAVCHVNVFRIVGGTKTITDNETNSAASGASLSVAMTVPANGGLIGGYANSDQATAVTWSDGTEASDADANDIRGSTVLDNQTTETSYTLQATGGNDVSQALAAIAFT